MEVENYISDTNVSNVEVKQLYKDKATLMVVMEKYKIKHIFNFRVKRSDNKRYVTHISYNILHFYNLFVNMLIMIHR